MKSATEYLLDLVAIPSVSAQTNQPMVDYIANALDPGLWNLHFHPHPDSSGAPKINVVATTRNAPSTNAELALVCHTDTVPFASDWAEAIHPVVRGGRLYGRGSCDVKSFLACMLALADSLDAKPLPQPLTLVFTADEEIGCVGAKHLAAIGAFQTRYLIIGEPTGLRPVRAGKGYALATITVTGKEAHSAFPSKGQSAIYDACRIVTALEHLAATLESRLNPAFDPPFTTVNVGLIDGGTAKNIVPGKCRITAEWRPVPGQDPHLVPNRIREILVGFPAQLDVIRVDPAFASSATDTLPILLGSLCGTEAGTISFGSEAAHLCGLAKETVVFGPGDMTVAHKSGEHIDLAELEHCAQTLKAAVHRLCCD